MHLFELIRKSIQLILIILCTASFVACGTHDTDKNSTNVQNINGNRVLGRQVIVRGLLGEPRTLDPQLADDTYSLQVIRDLYEGLTSEDASGHVVPGVALSWVVDPTGIEYTFRLRPGAKWSDGFPILAQQFVDGLRRAVEPKTASGSASLLTVIKGASRIIDGHANAQTLGVYAENDFIVRIVLEHPAPYLLEILSQPIAAPYRSLGVSTASFSSIHGEVPTNGPYYLIKRVPNSFIELAKNPSYWDANSVAIEHVRYLNSESETTELREYLAGQLDLTFTIPMPDLERMSLQYPSEVQVEPVLGTVYLALNLSTPPLKDSLGLRKALSMGIDRAFIAGRVMAGATPAYSLVARGVKGYIPPDYSWSQLTRDQRLRMAKTLFAMAGYSNEKPLRLKLYFNRDEGIQRLMAAIAGSWKQNLGVDCELISDEFRVFLAGRRDKNRWDVARLGWTADYNDPSSFLDVFAHDNSQDDTGYESVEYNALIDDAENQPEEKERTRLFREAEQTLLSSYPIIPIYFYQARRLVKPYVGGAQLTSMNRTYSKHLFWKGPR